MAYIKGTDFPDEVLIISGHLDHLGIKDSLVYYGADDNASGTASLMEIAQAFNNAKKAGFSPKRSVLISHFTYFFFLLLNGLEGNEKHSLFSGFVS